MFDLDHVRTRLDQLVLIDVFGVARMLNRLQDDVSEHLQLKCAIAAVSFFLYVGIPALLGPRVTVNPVVRTNLIKTVVAAFEMMRRVNKLLGTAFLIVTHNLELAKRCDRTVELVDGRLREPQPA